MDGGWASFGVTQLYASCHHCNSEGVYSDPECTSAGIDHGVLVVGYGTDPKYGDYWLVKNRFVLPFGKSKLPPLKHLKIQVLFFYLYCPVFQWGVWMVQLHARHFLTPSLSGQKNVSLCIHWLDQWRFVSFVRRTHIKCFLTIRKAYVENVENSRRFS